MQEKPREQIRWKRLKRVAKKISGQKIELVLATDIKGVLGSIMDDIDYYKDEKMFRIFLSPEVKSEPTTICVICHKLAHLLFYLKEEKNPEGEKLVEKQKQFLKAFAEEFATCAYKELEEELEFLQKTYGGYDR